MCNLKSHIVYWHLYYLYNFSHISLKFFNETNITTFQHSMIEMILW